MASRAERIEWVAGGISALAVLGMIGFFVQQALGGPGLPELVVSVEGVEEPGANGLAHVRYKVGNRGGQAATSVVVSVTLADGERRSVVIDEVPAQSEVTGGIHLPAGALGPALEMTVDGYVDP
jgi:uncharacterized protein (TIGR02588 family)